MAARDLCGASGRGGSTEGVDLLTCIDTLDETDHQRNGGILHFVLRNLLKAG